MNKDYADITVILDRSGSMNILRSPVEKSLDAFFEDQKKASGLCLASLYQFDEVYETVFEGVPIAEVPKVKLEPRGMTALHDAIGKTINSIGIRLDKMPEANKPGKVIVVIITDGLENASREYLYQDVIEAINHHRDVYKWEFVYLGANQDAIKVAQGMGIAQSSSMTFDTSDGAVYAAVASASAGVLRSRSEPSLQASFTHEDRSIQDGFLKFDKKVQDLNSGK